MGASHNSSFIWIFLSSFTNVLNDSISKTSLSNQSLCVVNLLFLRFLFSLLRSLPSYLGNRQRYHTTYTGIHVVRGLLFSVAMGGWTLSLINLPLNVMTLISLAVPLIVPMVAPFFLNERRDWNYTLFTLGGLMGLFLNLLHTSQGKISLAYVWIAFGAMLLFAALDILNKYLLEKKESIASMMLTTSFWSTVLTAPLALWYWQTPSLLELSMLIMLSLGGDFFFYSWLKALRGLPLWIVQPLRTMEFVVSCVLSVCVTRRWPSLSETISAMFIILTTSLVIKRQITSTKMLVDETVV